MKPMYQRVGGETCKNCGRIHKVGWLAPHDLWEEITGERDVTGLGMCVTCFDALCAANGIELTWECKINPRRTKKTSVEG